MRRNNTLPLKEVINEYLEAMKIKGPLAEIQAVQNWELIVGKAIASATKRIYIRDKKLYVELTSSLVRQELLVLTDSLIRVFNQKAGAELINKIILK